MRVARAIVMLSGLAAGLALAGDTYDIKVYPCPRALTPLRIDGVLSEGTWRRAPLVGGFTLYNAPELVEVQTYFRVLYDMECLYFGVTCEEPLMKRLVQVPQARDAHAVFSGEAVEIFIDLNHDHGRYFQFAVNAAGSVYDSRLTDPNWNADVRARTKLGTDRWTLEFAVPWKDLEVKPTKRMVVGFNVCRDRHLGALREWTNWSQTNANFHDPERFAHLVLSPTPEQLAVLGDEFRKGDRTGAIVVYSTTGFSTNTYRALAQQALEKLEGFLQELEQAKSQERDAASKAELERRLAGYREEVATIRAQLSGVTVIDAAAWAKIDLRIGQLTKELGTVIWEARLSALLSTL